LFPIELGGKKFAPFAENILNLQRINGLQNENRYRLSRTLHCHTKQNIIHKIMLLREKDRQALIRIFEQVEMPMEVWAYGSRVSRRAHEGSDLDLVIRTEHLEPMPWASYHDLRETIRDSNIPILVELHDWTRLPNSFHQNILAQYEVLFSSIVNPMTNS
jgi:uncharacterized protein